MANRPWKILLVEDDPDDYILTRAMFLESKGKDFFLEWAKTFESALQALDSNEFDAVLVDYDLGTRNGVEFVRAARSTNYSGPVILLTGRGNYEVDVEAMQAGASDYLSKSGVNAALLERTVRYAIERKQSELALRQAHLELEERVRERTEELSRAYEILSEREEGLRLILEQIPAVLWTTDTELNITSATGRGLASPRKTSIERLLGAINQAGPSQDQQSTSAHRKALRGQAVTYEDVSEGRVYQSHVEPLHGSHGQVVGCIGLALDVTDEKRSKNRLNYQAYLLENVNDAIIAADQNLVLTAWNRAAEAIYGWKTAEALGKPALDVLQSDETSISTADMLRRLSETGRFNAEVIQLRKDGKPVHVETKAIPLTDPDGKMAGFVAVNRDITERKLVEQALKSNEARFRKIYEESPLGIALKDLHGRILDSNPTLQEMLGYSAGEMRQKLFSDLTYPPDTRAEQHLFDRLRTGSIERYSMEKRYLHKDGSLVWARLAVSLVNIEPEPFAIFMVENITGQKQMEAELAEVRARLIENRENERLELAQDLHDGPMQELYAISYQLNELEEDTRAQGEANRELADRLETLQERLHAVVDELRGFSGALRPPTLTPFGLAITIESHAETFRQEHPEIDLELSLQADGQELPERLRLALYRIYQQSLVNVIRHAQASRVSVRFAFDPEQAVLEIEDNGLGFEPPKRWIDLVREGHLGLAGSAERAEAVGGRLEVESQPGKGTRLRVIAPSN